MAAKDPALAQILSMFERAYSLDSTRIPILTKAGISLRREQGASVSTLPNIGKSCPRPQISWQPYLSFPRFRCGYRPLRWPQLDNPSAESDNLLHYLALHQNCWQMEAYRFRRRTDSQLASAVHPPSTVSVCPLINPLSAPSARKAMARAISSGVAKRPIGTR